jgi:hypothetical protein
MQGSYIDKLEELYTYPAKTTVSGNGGIRFGYTFFKWLEIESGITISSHGFKIQIPDSFENYRTTFSPMDKSNIDLHDEIRVTYFEIPLLARIQTPFYSKSKNKRAYLLCGFNNGIMISAKERLNAVLYGYFGEKIDKLKLSEIDLTKDTTFTTSSGHSIHYRYKDFYRKNDLALAVGFGLERKGNNIVYFLEAKYHYSLLSFNRLSENGKKEIRDFYNSENIDTDAIVFNENRSFFRSITINLGFDVYTPKKKPATTK